MLLGIPGLTESGATIALIVKEVRACGANVVEVTVEAQEERVSHLLSEAGRMIGSLNCTPGYCKGLTLVGDKG